MKYNLILWVFLRKYKWNFTKIIEEMDKIINLEQNLKNIYQTINYEIFKNILIRKIKKIKNNLKFNKFKAN